MKARFLFALPLAILAPLVAGCSSSSSPDTTVDSGKADTGKVTEDAGGKKDTGTTEDGGTKDSGKDVKTGTPDTGVDAGSGPTPAAGSVTVNKGFASVLGKTDDDYIIFTDFNGNTFAGDITGKTTPILTASDSSTGPYASYVEGNYVFIFENYTTKSVEGETEIATTDLYVWSHTLGTPTKIATNASPQAFVATDSSAIAYLDGAQGTTATYGNLGVVAASAIGTTGGTDIATNIVIDLTSATCAPLVEFAGPVLVASTCVNGDGGQGSPVVTAYAGASWTPSVLSATAGISNPYSTTGGAAVNFTTDTTGVDAITVSNATPAGLSVVTVGGVGSTPISTNYGAVSGGTPNFFLSSKSDFALFTEASGSLKIARLSTPATPSTAVVSDLVGADGGSNSIYGFAGVSPNEQYELDYNTPPSATLGVPSSLTVRSIATGTGFLLFNNAAGFSFGGVNSWTADSSYAIFTDNLVAVPNMTEASVGTLKSANVATGAVNVLVGGTNATVWDSATLTGTDILYNQNYVPQQITLSDGTFPNGAAAADLYVADASKASQGTLVQPGADATYYVTSDKSHVFFSISAAVIGGEADTSLVPLANDGVYALKIPTP